MKNKTYKRVLSLVLILFFSVITIFCISNFNDNLSRVKESYLREYHFLVNSMTKDMIVQEGRMIERDKAVELCYLDYGNRYSRQNVFLQVYNEEICVYSSLIDKAFIEINQVVKDKESIVIEVVPIEGKKYIRICGYLPEGYNDYALVYYTDITAIVDNWIKNIGSMLLGAIMFAVALSICLLILIENLFKPLEKISTVSRKIAKGDYDEKLDIKGEGEIEEMVLSFNTMSNTIKTQIKKLEANAAEKQMLIDNLAHELRTPLTAIYGYAEYIQKTKLSEEKKYLSTQFILHESKRLKTISEMLLDLAALSEETVIEKIKIDVGELFKRLYQLENIKLREKDIRFKVHNEIDELYGNEELIESMFINFIDNAIKACDKTESKIVVRAYINEGHKIIEVNDNGKGIAKEQLEHVTEAFYRVDKARSRKEGGNGLGLALCQIIAEKHEAKIKLESELGKGTKISVIF